MKKYYKKETDNSDTTNTKSRKQPVNAIQQGTNTPQRQDTERKSRGASVCITEHYWYKRKPQ